VTEEKDMSQTINIVAYRPVPLQPRMGQSPLPMTPPASTRLPFIDSPILQLATDVSASVASGLLGYAFGRTKDADGNPRKPSRWSTVFWVVSALTGAKGLVDLYRMQR
jgi:hypothetical protein